MYLCLQIDNSFFVEFAALQRTSLFVFGCLVCYRFKGLCLPVHFRFLLLLLFAITIICFPEIGVVGMNKWITFSIVYSVKFLTTIWKIFNFI